MYSRNVELHGSQYSRWKALSDASSVRSGLRDPPQLAHLVVITSPGAAIHDVFAKRGVARLPILAVEGTVRCFLSPIWATRSTAARAPCSDHFTRCSHSRCIRETWSCTAPNTRGGRHCPMLPQSDLGYAIHRSSRTL